MSNGLNNVFSDGFVSLNRGDSDNSVDIITTNDVSTNGTTPVYSPNNPQFTLYSHDTGPNGFKVAEVLSELGLEYRTIFLAFGGGPNGMKTPAYEAINPNGRIPAIVDHSNGDFVVWESGAIITYICKKYDSEFKLWGRTIEEQAQIETWLHFQVSGQGPYLGQALFFGIYHTEKIPFVIGRYIAESRRVLGVVQKQLEKENSNGWLVLGRITVADIAFFQWWLHAGRVGIRIAEEFPAVYEWMSKIQARPGVIKGMAGSTVPAEVRGD